MIELLPCGFISSMSSGNEIPNHICDIVKAFGMFTDPIFIFSQLPLQVRRHFG